MQDFTARFTHAEGGELHVIAVEGRMQLTVKGGTSTFAFTASTEVQAEGERAAESLAKLLTSWANEQRAIRIEIRDRRWKEQRR